MVSYSDAVPVLVEAVKTQQKQMEALKQNNDAKLNQKEAEITELRAKLDTVLERLEKLEANHK